ncbi:MAG: hypothetical protein ABWY16_13055 [Pedobacter sp.]|uniref:hypothetical protein n=1 Tax=Pedobacter sp. TaxID=1411316 RepID=UPI003399C522
MNAEAICMSAAGSLCVQLLSLTEIGKLTEEHRPDFKDLAYYLPFILFPFISGIAGYAYFDEISPVNRLLALQVGASSPLLFKSLTNSIAPGLVHR